MEKKPSKLPLILSILALAVAIAALVLALRPAPQQQPHQPLAQAQQGQQPQQPTQPPQPQQPGQQPGQQPQQPESGAVQFVMYVGTNDKDTTEPICTPEEAKAKAIPILLKHFGGYTIQEANGGWKDGDTIYTEYSLVITLSDTDMEHVYAAADEFIKEFNQSSILIQVNQTKTEFYSGTAK